MISITTAKAANPKMYFIGCTAIIVVNTAMVGNISNAISKTESIPPNPIAVPPIIPTNSKEIAHKPTLLNSMSPNILAQRPFDGISCETFTFGTLIEAFFSITCAISIIFFVVSNLGS